MLSIPSTVTRAPGWPILRTSLRRWGASVALRPSDSHMSFTIEAMSASVASGKAAFRLRVARRDTPSAGPIARQSLPPNPDARPTGRMAKSPYAIHTTIATAKSLGRRPKTRRLCLTIASFFVPVSWPRILFSALACYPVCILQVQP